MTSATARLVAGWVPHPSGYMTREFNQTTFPSRREARCPAPTTRSGASGFARDGCVRRRPASASCCSVVRSRRQPEAGAYFCSGQIVSSELGCSGQVGVAAYVPEAAARWPPRVRLGVAFRAEEGL
jgi:hypothetical protein